MTPTGESEIVTKNSWFSYYLGHSVPGKVCSTKVFLNFGHKKSQRTCEDIARLTKMNTGRGMECGWLDVAHTQSPN